MTTTDMGDMRDPGSLDRSQRGGSIGLVLVIAIALVGAAVGLLQVGRGNTSLYILILLAVLGTIGVFSLFALAAGILRFAGQDSGNPMIRGLVDGAFDGILVTDSSGRVVYANCGLSEPDRCNQRRRRRGRSSGCSSATRCLGSGLSSARRRPAKAGACRSEVRVGGLKDEPARWLRLRVRPGDDKRNARTTVWTVADVTRDREKQENVFQELQHAIDYLDHAPAGFFSADAAGNIVYLNATLASWLDQDLAEVGSGGLKLTDVVSGEGAVAAGGPAGAGRCENRNSRSRLQDAERPIRSCPSFSTRSPFGADGEPGPSRTLVLEPRARRAAGRTARRRSALHALLQQLRRWRSRPSTDPAASCAPMRCSRDCSKARRQKVQARQHSLDGRRARPQHAGTGDCQSQRRAGRYCAGRGRPVRQRAKSSRLSS